MLDSWMESIFTSGMTLGGVLLCTGVAMGLGVLCALIYMFRNQYTKGFVVTLALLPVIVQVVIMLVNGNLGTGVAVMGAFSLIRFRSAPGSARDIGSIFLAMAIGLATGMGYLAWAVIFFLAVGAMTLLLWALPFARGKETKRILRITIPETLDFDGLFDDLLEEYAKTAQLQRVRTTNMGSLFELTYQIELKDTGTPKAFLDALRCRNGNLNISLSRPVENREEL